MTGEEAWGVVRTVLAALGGIAVGKGWIDSELLTALIGGGGTIFIAVWSVWSKRVGKAG
jgi:hypothetical protein